jgi:hypothetical protein
MNRPQRSLATVPLALLLVATGCGDDKKGGSSATGSPSASSSPSASASADPAAEAAEAARINLTAADLGAGFKGTPPDPEDDSASEETFVQEVYTCLGKPNTDDPDDDLPGEDITNAAGAEIASSLDFYDTEAQAKADFSIFSSDKIVGCLQSGFQKGLSAELADTGATVSDLKVTRRSELQVVPDCAAFRLNAKLTAQGQSISVVGDFVAILRGRIGLSIESFSSGQPLSDAVVTKAIKVVAARAEAAAA